MDEVFDVPYEGSGMTFPQWVIVTGRCTAASAEFLFGEVEAGRMELEDIEALPPSPVNVWAAEAAGEEARAADPALMHHDLFSEEGRARQLAQAELAADAAQPDGRRLPTHIPRPVPRYDRGTP